MCRWYFTQHPVTHHHQVPRIEAHKTSSLTLYCTPNTGGVVILKLKQIFFWACQQLMMIVTTRSPRSVTSMWVSTRILYRPAGRTTLDGRYRTSHICAEIHLLFGRLTNVDKITRSICQRGQCAFTERSTQHWQNSFPIHTYPVHRGWLPMEAS